MTENPAENGLLRPEGCICPMFRDTGGFRIADLCCPVHGVNGTDPGDGYWEHVTPPVEHVVIGTDEVNHPYRVQCACGEWCYDFAAHLTRVLPPVVGREVTP